MSRHRRFLTNDFVIITTVFFAVLSIGLIFGLANLRLVSQSSGSATSAPTLTEYRTNANSILGPFLDQWPNVTPEALASAGGPLQEMVAMTQERLLRLRVPTGAKDDHLLIVLLLDKWKRALAGSTADQRNLLEMTGQTIAGLSWLGR